MSKKSLTISAFVFLIFIYLICQTASATTYTFNHARCSSENVTVCVCDSYSSTTDTCTISGPHIFPKSGDNDIELKLYFDNLDIESSGSLVATTEYGVASISIDSRDIDIYGIIDAVTRSKHVSTVGTTSKLIIKADTRLRIHSGGKIGNATYGYAMALAIDTGTLIVYGLINNSRDNTFSSGLDDYSLSGATAIKADSISLLGSGLVKSGNKITQSITYCTLSPEECEDAAGCPYISAEPGKLFLSRYCEFPPPTCSGGDGCTQPCTPVDPDCPPAPTCSGGDGCTQPCTPVDPDCPLPPPPAAAPTLLSLDGTVTDTNNQPINGTVTVQSLKTCTNTGCSAFSGFVSLAGTANVVPIIDGIVNGMIGPYNLFTDITYFLTVDVCNDLVPTLCDQVQIRFTD